jgi:APA family basic amino acid/polyamine antiporter
VQGLTSGLKALVLLALVAVFLLRAPGGELAVAAPVAPAEGRALAVAVLIALQAVIYTYDGWYGVIYFGEEVRRPARDVPRSMIGGVLLIAGLYLLVNVALLQVLPPAAMAGQSLAAGAATARIFGPTGDIVIRAVAIISLVSGINAYQLMASRIPLAMGREGLLPPRFVHVNAGGTPTLGLALSTLAALIFIASGSFQRVMALMAFFFVANYVAAFVAVFVLRRREPQEPRPYRAWGYPWTTALALAVSIAFLVGAVAGDTRNSVRSLLVLAASYPVYRLVRRFGGAWNRR